jgi:hypothetical protein
MMPRWSFALALVIPLAGCNATEDLGDGNGATGDAAVIDGAANVDDARSPSSDASIDAAHDDAQSPLPPRDASTDASTDDAHADASDPCASCVSGPHATATCTAGKCALSCDPGFDDCNKAPADGCEAHLADDPSHCGTCASACGAGVACTSGTCDPTCSGGKSLCGGQCFDTASDPNHCGNCGTSCGAGQTCTSGHCTCLGAAVLCNSACVDVKGDGANCGTCGHACGAGDVCSNGACAHVCAGSTKLCGSSCVNTSSDDNNCGACGNACGTGSTCTGGVCKCFASLTACGASCIDTRSDAKNCGACGHACAAGEVCSAGSCAPVCTGATKACGASCVDEATDPSNCGACGRACTGGQVCAIGQCTCSGGTSLCGGWCVDFQSDMANCGACGHGCAPSETCSAGVCKRVCTGGTTLCGSSCVDESSDPNNCGACGHTCSGGQICSGGQCTCTGGRALCNGACIDESSDTANCGACGNACAAPLGGSATCANRQCGTSCPTGENLCGGACTNPRSTDACGPSCTVCPTDPNGSPTCDGTKCDLACISGFHTCGGVCGSNGDVASCGASCTPCPTSPNGVATCNGITCGLTCNAPYVKIGSTCDLTPARPLAPLSTSTVTSHRPVLRWAPAPAADGTRVELCSDRACTHVIQTIDAAGSTAQPAQSLTAGVVFWRLKSRLAGVTATAASATWQFTVGGEDAPGSTSWGSQPDIDGDGFGDVITAMVTQIGNNNSYTIRWYRGSRSGLGATAAQMLTLGAGFGLNHVGDVNGDGFPDFLISGGGQAFLYSGSPSGLGSNPRAYPVDLSDARPLNDVNGDGYGDVIVNGHHVMLGSADGLTEAVPAFDLGAGAVSNRGTAVGADFNGDGYGDLVAFHKSYTPSWPIDCGLKIYHGSPQGLVLDTTWDMPGFANESSSNPGEYSDQWASEVVTAADVNGDGYPDLIAGDHWTLSNMSSNFLRVTYGGPGGLDGTKTVNLPWTTRSFSGLVGVYDANGDGYQDLFVGAYDETQWVAGSPTAFGKAPAHAPFDYNVTATDIDGDGYVDFVFYTNALANIYKGTASGASPSPSLSLASNVSVN